MKARVIINYEGNFTEEDLKRVSEAKPDFQFV